MSRWEELGSLFFYLAPDWQAAGHQQAAPPLLIGWAPGRGPVSAKGTLARTEAPRWSKLWEREGREKWNVIMFICGPSTEGNALSSGSMWDPMWPSASYELEWYEKTTVLWKMPEMEAHEWSGVSSTTLSHTQTGPWGKELRGHVLCEVMRKHIHRFQTTHCLDCCHRADELWTLIVTRFRPGGRQSACLLSTLKPINTAEGATSQYLF